MSKPTQLYEIHTAAYLSRLGEQLGRSATLTDMPDSDIAALANRGIDALWLMGVWQRSPEGVNQAKTDESLMNELRHTLDDFRDEDIIGSAYAVREYVVDERFGGNQSLIQLHDRLRHYNIKLILDFVPNHTALDHPWIANNPDYYIVGSEQDIATSPEYFSRRGECIVANGRDPNYPAWRDTAQVNAFAPGYRQASIDTLRSLTSLCDGVRCDMAMLMMNDIFVQTWRTYIQDVPATEYWQDVIADIRQTNPEFIFIAEAYWHTESDLIALGFDVCYDKNLYDLLLDGSGKEIARYLEANRDQLSSSMHFIENHDEQRAAATFPMGRHFAAACLMALLPGLRLWHDGQWQGNVVHIPVQLARGPHETPRDDIATFYDTLLSTLYNNLSCSWQPRSRHLTILCLSCSQHQHEVVINFSDHVQTIPQNSLIRDMANLSAISLTPPYERTSIDDTELTLQAWQVLLIGE